MEFAHNEHALEAKAITSSGSSTSYDEMMRTFEALKTNHEEELAQFNRRADVRCRKRARASTQRLTASSTSFR